MVDLGSYLLGVAQLAVVLLSLGFAAFRLRARLLPCWSGAPARLVEIITGVALLVWIVEILGTFHLFYPGAVVLASVLVALAALAPAGGAVGGTAPEEALATAGGGGSPAATGPAGVRLALALFLLAAGVCSLLAFANAPVGPTSYSPALTGLRPLVANSSTLVLAPDELLADQHGTPYIAWELRGGRVCIAAESENDGTPPPGVRFVVTTGDASQPPYPYLRVRRVAPPYVLWEVTERVGGKSPCPLIAVRQARQGPAR